MYAFLRVKMKITYWLLTFRKSDFISSVLLRNRTDKNVVCDIRSARTFGTPTAAQLADLGELNLFATILSHFQQKNLNKLNGVYNNNAVKQKTASAVFFLLYSFIG